MDQAVRVAWDVEGIRDAHHEFISHWEREDAASDLPPLTARTLLVADWLALLRLDPRLPRQYMGADWPADRSYELFTRRHREFAFPAVREFAARVA
jgi:phenylacetic acid degradation operon negative regulatory protein